jgi:hypothetical protein
MKSNVLSLLFMCCWLSARPAGAADIPSDIPDAPLSDDTLQPRLHGRRQEYPKR